MEAIKTIDIDNIMSKNLNQFWENLLKYYHNLKSNGMLSLSSRCLGQPLLIIAIVTLCDSEIKDV